jgi:5-formyltetrahydrofolate cyclo-ligase
MPIQNPEQNTAVELRARLRQARNEIPEPQRDRGSLLMRGRLYTWLIAAREASGQPLCTVAAFWPLPGEPDLRPLLTQWAEGGTKVCLPCVTNPDAPLEFRNWTPSTAMREGRYGIAEPAEGPAVIPDVLLVPTLGYSDAADRLGYGGGYYDRTLAALADAGHRAVAIGIAWNEGRLPNSYLPADHDVRLDAVLTPEGWVPEAPLSAAPARGSGLLRFILR